VIHPFATPAAGRAVRALAAEIDAELGPTGRDTLLRGAGRRLATLMALPEVDSMEALEAEANAALTELGWGSVRFALNEAEQTLLIHHDNLPTVGGAGEPAGLWLAAILEGLYETWLGRQPGADPALTARRDPVGSAGRSVIIRYRRR
jgi:hypothetical protein